MMRQKVYKGHIIERAFFNDRNWMTVFEERYEVERIKVKSEAAKKKRRKPAVERELSQIKGMLNRLLERL